MPRRKRQGNDPRRRIARKGSVTSETRAKLAKAIYTGSAHHKSKAGGGYKFIPPVNPRPDKSLCDDLRTITLLQATKLFRSGVLLEMVSTQVKNGLPKFVWAVDSYGEAYEAILAGNSPEYHGYRLHRDQRARDFIIATWKERREH